MNANPPAVSQRRHDIDALRVLVFGLLILFHVGMFYVADWDWHVKSAYQSETLQLLMRFTNQWRMPLLFVISGIASSFLFAKVPARQFAASRTRRLLIPLLFGMAVVVVPQAYYEAVFRGAFQGGYAEFMWRYFTLQPWPEGAFAGSNIGVTWMHLWYLPYLLFYTLLFIPFASLIERHGRRSRERFRGQVLLWGPVALLIAYGYTLFPVFGGVSHNFYTDWYAHAMYFTLFAIGYLIGRDDDVWAEILRLRWWTLGIGVTAFGVLALPREMIPIPDGPVRLFVEYVFVYSNRWMWILAALGWSYRWLNRPFKWLPYATEAVYPWYILHQTITVWIGFQVSSHALGPVVEPMVVLGVTIAGCVLLHEFVIRRVGWLRPLFGLPKPRSVSFSADASSRQQYSRV